MPKSPAYLFSEAGRNARLDEINAAGIKAAVLTTQTPPEDREAWYERQIRAGVQAFIGHPRLVQTGLDFLPSNYLVSDRILHVYAEAGGPPSAAHAPDQARDACC